MDAHGELNVTAVDPWDEALVRQWANNITYAVRRDGDGVELETSIREGLRTLLRDGSVPEALAAGHPAPTSAAERERRLDFWETALQRGLLLTAGDRVVWLRPVLRDLEALPPGESPVEQYTLNWGSLTTAEKSRWEGAGMSGRSC